MNWFDKACAELDDELEDGIIDEHEHTEIIKGLRAELAEIRADNENSSEGCW